MIKLLWFLKPYRNILIVVLVLALGQAMSNLYLPNLMANIVDNGIVKNNTAYIWTTGGLMMLVATGGTLSAIIGIFFSSQVAIRSGKIVRAKIFTHVEHFSLHEFDAVGTASLITRTTNDTTQVQNVLLMLLNVMITAPITLIGGIILALNQDVGLSWIFVVIIPLLAGVIVETCRRPSISNGSTMSMRRRFLPSCSTSPAMKPTPGTCCRTFSSSWSANRN